MKKSIIIVFAIAMAILGLFVFMRQGKTLNGTLNNLQSERSVVLEKMEDAVLNVAALDIFLAVDDFYRANNTGFFENDSPSINKINTYVAEIKSDKGIDVEYSIHSTNQHYSVKVKAKGANNFYCLDTVNVDSVKPIVVDSAADFTQKVDCKGELLK